MLHSLPLGPPARVLAHGPTYGHEVSPPYCLCHVSRVTETQACLQKALYRVAHASQRVLVCRSPSQAEAVAGARPPLCRSRAICFRMLITSLFLDRSTIFNILLLLLKDNIRELKT